jgi:uncharacterized protein (DUF58 family)/transglutaminase-like putative cysteine protease
MLSRRGGAALVVAGAFALLGVAISAGRVLEVGIALATLVALDVAATILIRPASLLVKPCPPLPVVASGGQTELLFEVTNQARRRASHLVMELASATEQRQGQSVPLGVRVVVPDLAPGATARLGCSLPPLPRGHWLVTTVLARSSGPLGLAERRRALGTQLAVTVHPAPDPLPTTPVPGPAPAVADGVDEDRAPIGVRAFADGDPIRLVHWPSSLRRGTLMVRELAEQGPDQTVLVLDLRPEVHEQGSFESMLEQAASILLDPPGGSPVRMVTTAGADSGRLATVEGRRSALVALATIQPEPGLAPTELTQRLSAARQARRVVVLSGPRAGSPAEEPYARHGTAWLRGRPGGGPAAPPARAGAETPPERPQSRPAPAPTLARALAVALGTAWVGRLFIGSGWVTPVLVGLGLVSLAALASVVRPSGGGIGRLGRLGAAVLITLVIDTWLVTGTPPGIAEARLIASSLRRAPAELHLVGVPAPELAPLVIGLALLGALSLAVAEGLGPRHRFAALVPIACLVAFSGAEHLGQPNLKSALWVGIIGLAAWTSGALERGIPADESPAGAGRRLRRAAQALGAIGTSTVVAALTATPLLGALGGGLVKVHPDSASLAVSIDPLVSLVPDLEQVGGPVLFTVKTTSPDYWRLETLTTFNGVTWLPSRVSTSSGILQAGATATSGLPRAISPDPHGTFTLEQFHLEHLASAALPVGGDPVQVTGAPLVSWHPSAAELNTVDGLPLPLGTTYQVLAFQPAYSATVLASATVPTSPPPGTLSLPTVPAKVEALAKAIVAHAPTPYAKALAIQNYLRTHEHYDLNVPSGTGNPLERFLFVTHEGYCQQFAGAFGVLARLVGLPTRLAVGFTPGTLVGHDSYQVSAADVHTWPEVDFTGLGWVRFEPTPGRGAPGEQAYDGVKPAQVGATKPTSVAPVRYPTPAVKTATSTTTSPSAPRATTGGRPSTGSTTATAPASTGSRPSRQTGPRLLLLGPLVALLAGGSALALRRRSGRSQPVRSRTAGSPSWWLSLLALAKRLHRGPDRLLWPGAAERSAATARARRSWERAVFEAERWVGKNRRDHPGPRRPAGPSTPRQRTARVAEALPAQAELALLEVLAQAERAAFGPPEQAPTSAARAEEARAELHRLLRSSSDLKVRPEHVR